MGRLKILKNEKNKKEVGNESECVLQRWRVGMLSGGFDLNEWLDRHGDDNNDYEGADE